MPPLAAQAKSTEIYTGWLSSSAVGGYDPVAYFTEGKPVAGNSGITHQWKGATWRFASEKNRDLFKAEPAKYAPQYGGYCAWAVSQGYTAKGDPNHWKIVDGKLYPQLRRERAEELGEGHPGPHHEREQELAEGAGEVGLAAQRHHVSARAAAQRRANLLGQLAVDERLADDLRLADAGEPGASANPVMNRIGIAGLPAWTRRASSAPLMPGIAKSISIRSTSARSHRDSRAARRCPLPTT